tara:strand:+ start:2442 stop:3542 length:1101 start_codon:yes stop_codon:yes gene_type:complete
MNDSKYICTKPFTWLELGDNGICWMCCPSWLPTPIGNLLIEPFDKVWNGEIAQDIRQSMYDGSYSYCNDNCPFKKKHDGPIARKKDIISNISFDKRFRDSVDKELTILPYKPTAINAVYDRSCNLSCPSCRTKVFVAIGTQKDRVLEVQKTMINDCMDDCYHLTITGSGDPFGSPYFRKFLQNLDPEKFPQLCHIHLHTNAMLWTEAAWNKLKRIHHLIKSAEISIDACSSETYSINRRGGDWDKLMENIEFISKIRVLRAVRAKPDAIQPIEMRISFVVQQNNWREMKDFVRLGMKYDFNVSFGKLVDWGTWSQDELHSRQVHRPDHPEHGQFIKFLHDPIFFKKNKVQLGNMRHLISTNPVPLM